MNNLHLDPTAIVVALIVAVPAILSWWTSRNNTKAIERVHISINSRMTQLLAASKGEAKAEGKEEGRAESKTKKQTP